jgi:hypothetical protein
MGFYTIKKICDGKNRNLQVALFMKNNDKYLLSIPLPQLLWKSVL